jgi:ribosomal protein L29
MATTKKTTKAVKKAPEIKTIDQLNLDLVAKQADLVDAKRGHKAGELANPRVITATRKEVARIHTAISAAKYNEQKENK